MHSGASGSRPEQLNDSKKHTSKQKGPQSRYHPQLVRRASLSQPSRGVLRTTCAKGQLVTTIKESASHHTGEDGEEPGKPAKRRRTEEEEREKGRGEGRVG